MKLIHKKGAPVEEGFVGLVADNDGEIWLFINYGAIFLNCFSGELSAIDDKLKTDYGPFTKFTGSVTISN